MGIYSDVVLPRLCDLAMRNRRFLSYRERVTALAEGNVLEIGSGSGLNLPLYGGSVREVVALEPMPKLIAMAQPRARHGALHVMFVEASAEAIPLESASVDAVVTTWTLCSIPDVVAALGEMRRVLRPRGRLLFVEHGLAPDAGVRRWQQRLTPAWRRISGGCHLDRPIARLIDDAGFRMDKLTTGYMRGPRPMTWMYEGVAVRE